jgi:sec-independent protein translocase protein TatA
MGIDNPVHILFLGVIALVVLGPRRLPDLAKALGNGIREFRESVNLGENDSPPASASSAAGPASATPAAAPVETPPVQAAPVQSAPVQTPTVPLPLQTQPEQTSPVRASPTELEDPDRR